MGYGDGGAYQSAGSYILLGGYDLKLTPVTGGDTSKAYQLICLYVSGGDYVYDTLYAGTRHTPGGMVTGIQIRSSDIQWPGAAFVFGTLPQGDGSVHWVEVLNPLDGTVLSSLGSNEFDGPIYNMASLSELPPIQRVFVGSFRNALFSGTPPP